MHAINLGPLALPVGPLWLLLVLGLVAWWTGRRAGPAHAPALGACIQNAVLLGLLAARLVHLALHTQAYAASPLGMLDIRDGGWHAPAGWSAGLAWLAWCARRQPAWRRPLAVGACAAVVVWGGGRIMLDQATERAMPAVTLQSFEGGARATLAEAARGRPVVVNLWASWCGPCRQEMPLLAQAQAQHADIGFLFVNQGESPAAVRAYLADEGLALREVWLDASSQLGPAIGSRGLPTTLFYGADGRLRELHFGVLTAPALRVHLESLADKRASP